MAGSNATAGTRQGVVVKHTSENTTIDRILECAVALNWNALTQTDEVTALQVEYRVGPSHSLEYLKLWSSTTRGIWNLVCEYWMQSSSTHESGTTFTRIKPPSDFTWMLDAIMQHQRAFLPGSSDFMDGLVQINAPTNLDLVSAQTDMTEALDRIGSHRRYDDVGGRAGSSSND